jgi:hypothetical protein
VTVAIWAEIEHGLGILLTDMLGTDAKLGLAIFFAMRTEGPQREVIKATAEQRLPPEMAAKVVKFVTDLRDRTKGRNAVAHGIWGLSDKHPDELVWMDLETTVRVLGQFDFLDTPDAPPTMIYTLCNLQEISSHAASVLEALGQLIAEVVHLLHGGPPPPP